MDGWTKEVIELFVYAFIPTFATLVIWLVGLKGNQQG